MTARASLAASVPGSGQAPSTAQPTDLPLSLRFSWGIGTLGPVTLLYVVNFALLFFMTNLLGIGEMTASQQERTRLISVRVAFVALSGLVGIALANWLVAFFGGSLSAYGATALIMAAISLAAMMYSVIGTASAHATRRTPAVADLRGAIRSVLSNRPFVVLIFAKLMLLLSLSAITTTMYYVVVQIMQRTPGVLSLYGIANNLGIVAALLFWAWLGRRFSKQMVFAIAILAGVPLSLSWLLASPAEPIWFFCARALLTGVAAGGSLVMGQSLLPDTIEYDFRRTELRREGVFAAGPLIVGAFLSQFGYVSSKAGAVPVLQSKGALTGIYIGVAVVRRWQP